MSEKVCGSCRYWVRLDEGNIGDCRKNPPLMIQAGLPYSMRIWPNTYEIDWCGEFKQDKDIKKDSIVKKSGAEAGEEK